MIRLILYAHKSAAQDIYLQACAAAGVEVELVSSFVDFYQSADSRKYNGLLVDIVSSIRASATDRLILKDLMAVYPTLRLRWDPAGGQLRTLMTGAGVEQSISIDTFVANYCRAFTPQALRLYPRREICCSLWRSASAQIDEMTSERTITADLSEGGCFIYSSSLLAIGSTLWLRFVNLGDPQPIKCTVVWCRAWGTTLQFPGAGVQFMDITAQQKEEIADLIGGDLW